jgi:hypothetical protein
MGQGRLRELKQKYNQFFGDSSKGQILCLICPYTFSIDYSTYGLEPGRGLDTWDYDRDLEKYILNSIKSLRAFMDYTKDLDNDYVPALNPHFGYGDHSAFFSGENVIMGEETSWTKPFLASWDKLPELKLDRNRYWYRKILESYEFYKKFWEGDYLLASYSHAGPGDMANAIRGDDLFYDLYDEPDKVHTLMDRCADAVIQLAEDIAKITDPVNREMGEGNAAANVWFPGNAPYLSEDFNDLCSADQYREFGSKYTQKIISQFGGAFIHHHARGRHIHHEVAKLKGLKLLEISLDPKCQRPVDDLPRLFEEHNGLPLMIRCHANDLEDNIEDLKRGRVVIMLNVDSLDQARESMKFIRKNSII